MFIGHFAVGLAAKRATPKVSLAVLFAAAQLADIVWPVLVALGVEQVRIAPANPPFLRLDFISYPYSHSLLALAVWGVAFGFLYQTLTRRNGGTFAVLAALVLSHWVLDVATHRPDMPVLPSGPRIGLGLWYSTAATLVVEAVMFAVGLWIYTASTRARDRAGSWGFFGLMAFLVVVYAASLGSAPPSVTAVWSSAMIGFLLIVVWTAWADRHRDPV